VVTIVVLATAAGLFSCGSFAGTDNPVSAVPGDERAADGPTGSGGEAGTGLPDASAPGDAGAEAANDAGCASCSRYVFITSTTFQGNLGGLIGATKICLAAADAAGGPLVGRQWEVWLSTSTSAAKDRLVHGTGGYKLVNGTPIAASWDDLVTTTHQAAINRTELNAVLSGQYVWTATDDKGSDTMVSCQDWSLNMNNNKGWVGLNSSLPEWTSALSGSLACDQLAALYCIEK
jgi:hypothetical protein